MLTVIDKLNAQILASDTTRADGPFSCPECTSVVILKQGKKVIEHFAHKPPVSCLYGSGESSEHLSCKKALVGYLETIPWVTKIAVEKKRGSIRPDVSFLVDGKRAGIEVQRSDLTREKIEQRTLAYLGENAAVMWLLLDLPSVGGDHPDDAVKVKDWQLWLHGLYFGRVFVWDPKTVSVRPIFLTSYEVEEHNSWHDRDGNSRSAHTIRYPKTFRTASAGPPISSLEIKRRTEHKSLFKSWPECLLLVGRRH